VTPKCEHLNRAKHSDYEESTQIDGKWRTIRIARTKCVTCPAIFMSRIHKDAVASNRDVDGYYGVTYE